MPNKVYNIQLLESSGEFTDTTSTKKGVRIVNSRALPGIYDRLDMSFGKNKDRYEIESKEITIRDKAGWAADLVDELSKRTEGREGVTLMTHVEFKEHGDFRYEHGNERVSGSLTANLMISLEPDFLSEKDRGEWFRQITEIGRKVAGSGIEFRNKSERDAGKNEKGIYVYFSVAFSEELGEDNHAYRGRQIKDETWENAYKETPERVLKLQETIGRIEITITWYTQMVSSYEQLKEGLRKTKENYFSELEAKSTVKEEVSDLAVLFDNAAHDKKVIDRTEGSRIRDSTFSKEDKF